MAKNFVIYNTPVSPSILANMRGIYYIPDYYGPRDYPFLSRYANTRRILDKNLSVLYDETYSLKKIPESESDVYVTVNSHNKNRLDIIANENYQYSLYWWVIAIANDILDPFDVPEGTVLRIPPLSSLYSEGSVLG